MKKLVLILLLFTINVFSQTIPTYSHDSGTRSPIWKIGLKGGAIKWENDSLLYKVLWDNQGGSVFGDSAYFVLTKNPNNLPQLITGKKYFYRSAIDTLTTRILKLQLGYLIDPLTLHWGDMIFHGSGLNSFFIFKTAPISGWEWLDTLVSRKYMRYRYESGIDETFNYVYRSKYLANGYAKEIPYQIGSGITGFIPAPTDTNYVLTGAMRWKAVNSGTTIDTTKLAYLTKNNTFTGINTFRDILFSGTGRFYLPTSDMMTNGTMFLNGAIINYYSTTGNLYSLVNNIDLNNALATKITNPTNAYGFLVNDGLGNIGWGGSAQFQTMWENTIGNNYYTKTNLQTSGQAQVHFNNLTNKPTTLSGYGITDAAGLGLNNTFTGVNTFNTINIGVGNNFNLNGNLISGSSSKIVLPSNLQGTLSGSIWFDGADLKVYSGLSTITLSKVGHSHTFSEITSKPTTLSGYGITDAAGLGLNNTFTGVNTFRDILFSGTGKFYLPTSDMTTSGTMFLNNSTIKYYTTTGTLYSLATTTDLLNGLASKITNPTNAHGVLKNDGTGIIYWQAITGTDISNALGYTPTYIYDYGASTSYTWSSSKINTELNDRASLSANNIFNGKQTFIDSVSFKGSMLLADEDSVYLANNASWSASGKNALTIYSVDNNYTLTITNGVNGQMLWVTNSITSLFTLNITPIRYGTSTTLGLAAGKSVLLRYKNGKWYVASL